MRCNIIDLIKKYLYLLKNVEQVYVFGSVLEQNKIPRDIDVLIIYSEYSNEIQWQIKEFEMKLANKTKMLVDLTLLSFEEERQVCFLEKIKAIKLK